MGNPQLVIELSHPELVRLTLLLWRVLVVAVLVWKDNDYKEKEDILANCSSNFDHQRKESEGTEFKIRGGKLI
jgi:hypothetical protein